MAKQGDRFIKTFSQGNSFGTQMQIWADKQTGVDYLFQANGYAGGLTPLLKADGTPVVTPVFRYEGYYAAAPGLKQPGGCVFRSYCIDINRLKRNFL